MTELVALLEDREVGTVRQVRGRLSFTYAATWRDGEGAHPLSLSMPLAATEHPHAVVEPFLWGLLPDNEFVLRRWGQRFHVSPRNPFALLTHVGEDCAGAVRFVAPDHRETLLSGPRGTVDWLTEAEVANRLRSLQSDASAGRAADDTGQFSLAGAQPKTALSFDGQRWGVPSGREPTTHILKPQTGEFDGHAENEHLCLMLARALGLPTARSEVRRFEDVTAIVVERYDRIQIAIQGPVYRVHQEDMCQALGVHPMRKYQNDGGPGPKDIAALLRTHAIGDDIATFRDALILNWLIGGSDAHAKNYSLLIGGGGTVRLAPLYDLASILAHPNIDAGKARMAMKIGDEYRLRAIGVPEWRKAAMDMRVAPDALVERIRSMAMELPDRLADEIRRLAATGVTHPAIDRMARELPRRAAEVGRL